MDFDLKQWRDHHSQPTPSPKLPPSASTALPLFVSEPNSNLSAFPSDHPTRIPSSLSLSLSSVSERMGSYFSLSQWQELELQALIFRHMIAGADVPPELLHLVKKSLITSPFHLSHHFYPHFQPSLLQSGYWGRAAMDPEPGRCRRTDGKKWRCSRDVVAGQKYCERHMHRGKNRSRKHVETPTSAASPYSGGDALKTSTNSLTRQGVAVAGGDPPHFTLSVPSHSTDLLHLNQRPLHGSNDAPHPGGRTLRHFFDYEPDNATNLSISMPGNPSSDFSLKLATGSGDDGPSAQLEGSERDKPQLNWGMAWETNPVAPMGGPLAEVLRSSTSHSSPTSVLHRLPRAPPSEASY
ncbi:hypothetical protein C2S51_035346 [Perilla frutescens var. frutescens]|nr:hypothetical protein C2S51_035346 [Perilla frutescens var. frutescens]